MSLEQYGMINIIISLILSFVGKYKWYLIAGGVAIAMALSGIGGYRIAAYKYQNEKIKALKNYIEQVDMMAEQRKEIDASVNEDLQNLEDRNRNLEGKIDDYLDQINKPSECDLDSYGLQLWNGETKD